MTAALQAGEGMVVRLGGQDYAVDHDWAGLQRKGDRTLVSDIACVGEWIWALCRGPVPLRVFDGNGAVVADSGHGLIQDGHGMDADGDGGVVLTDRDAHEVLRIAAEGTVIGRWGERDRPYWAAPFNHPAGVTRAADGGLWVADGYGNARVHRFDATGDITLSFGELGEGPGQFRCPHAIAVAPDGRVLVCDRDDDRVQVFAQTGALLAIWTGFARPMAVAIGPDGWVYVTDHVPSLHRIAPDGSSRSRARPARNMPHGLAIAADGTIYLAEMNPPSLVRLRLL